MGGKKGEGWKCWLGGDTRFRNNAEWRRGSNKKKKKRKQMEVAGGSVSAYCFATGNDLRRTIVRRVFPFRETSKTIRVALFWKLGRRNLEEKVENWQWFPFLLPPLLVPFLIYVLSILLVIKSEKRRCCETKVKETYTYIYYTCKDFVKLKDKSGNIQFFYSSFHFFLFRKTLT